MIRCLGVVTLLVSDRAEVLWEPISYSVLYYVVGFSQATRDRVKPSPWLVRRETVTTALAPNVSPEYGSWGECELEPRFRR